jgi:energy-coupling factor transporter ATP-binding protein EcfA2
MERPEELDRFRIRLSEALRIGHGLGVAFQIEFRSGIGGGITFSANGPVAGRWFGRVVAVAYDHHRWILSDPPARRDPRLLRVGLPVLSWPHPLRSGFERGNWGDSIALGMGALPPGLGLLWSLRAAATPHPRVLLGTVMPPGPTSPGALARSPGSLSDVERRWRDRWEEQQHALRWAATVALVSGPVVPTRTTVDRAAEVVRSVTRSSGGNGIRLRAASRWWTPRPPPFVLTEPELIGLLPSPECASRDVRPAPVHVPRELVLGRTDLGTPLELRLDPDEGRHLAVLGETGMGKSTLLTTLARQAGGAHGVVLFDPVGDTGRALLSALAPEARAHAVWVSPAEAPIGLNALAGTEEHRGMPQPRQIADLVQALRRVRSGRYVESTYWGPRIEEMVTRALLAAGTLPEGTLADALELLEAPERGRSPIAGAAGAAWRDLRSRTRERPEEVDGARRLLYEIVGNPVLAHLLCERRPRWSPSELLVDGRITVVTGDAARIGEGPARHLLSMYLALLGSEILARSRPTKTFVILDEAQWFGHEGLSEMLRIGRRFNVHLVVATQALGSLSEGVREAIGTNVADFVLFRGSSDDAREFGRIARSVSPDELMSLGRGEAILLRGKGGQFDRLRTPLGPPHGTDAAVLREIARSSMARFAARDEVPAAAPLGTLPSGPSPVPSIPRGVDAAARALLERIAGRPDRDPVRVHLEALRRGNDDGALRALGAILGREGILRHGRDEGGAFWEICPAEVRASLLPVRPPSVSGA